MISSDASQTNKDTRARLRRLLSVAGLVAVVVAASGVVTASEDDRNDQGLVRRTVGCGGFHAVRVNGNANLSEMFTSNISVRNQNPDDSVTIERITIHDIFGNVAFDAGAAAGAPLPPN